MFFGLHTVAQGTVGMAVAIAELAKQGYAICVPLVDAQPYDLVVDDGEKLLKVQVKTTGVEKNGSFIVQMKRVHHNKNGNQIRNFDNSKVDTVVVLCSNGSVYVMPSAEVKSKSSLTLNRKYDKYKALGRVAESGLRHSS